MKILNSTPDLNLILPKVFLFVTGTLIAFLHILLSKFHKLDVICLSETYLDSSISNDDDNLEHPDYDLFRADHPSNTTQGSICIYYKKSLSLKILNIQYLHESINFEIRIGGKLFRFVSLYCSPSHSQDNFESVVNNFELNIEIATANDTFLTVALGDFNTKSNLWLKGNKTTYEGSKIDGITSTFGLQQLIFPLQPNFVMQSGVHSSLHPICHHQHSYQQQIFQLIMF